MTDSAIGRTTGASRLAGARVLVVDDDPVVREALCDILALYDADAYPFRTVAEGLEQARVSAATPDAVLLDLGVTDSQEADPLAPWARACPGAVVVVMTGADPEEVALRVGRARRWTFLAKPFGLEDLVETLAAALTAGRPERPTRDA